jgi:3-hydroxybutyryl-CoA dehydratase
VHLDERYAAGTRFRRRIAHGMLIGSYISGVLGTKFPGPGTIYMSQNMRFLKPVYFGDAIRVVVTVTGYRADKAILSLRTDCYNQRGEQVIAGDAVCLVSDVSFTLPSQEAELPATAREAAG